MKSENEALSLVKEKFPYQHWHIEALFANNEHFNELCLDYLLCVQTLEKSVGNADENQEWIQEYEDLRADLESELFHFILRYKLD